MSPDTPMSCHLLTFIRVKGETMIPEGLEFASAEEILDKIASVGFSFVRISVRPLTHA